MIFDGRPDDDIDRDIRDDDNEHDPGESGEWLDGLRAAGLPVRSELAARRVDQRAVSLMVQELVTESWAPRTRSGYEADWSQFAVWCRVHGIVDPLNADEIDVAEWVASLVERHLAIATIRRYLAAVGWAFEATGRASPTRSRSVRQVVAGASRRLGTAQRRAEPLRLAQLRRLIIGLPIVSGTSAKRSPRVRRDQALLALGWAAALRSEELVGVDVDDITITGDANTGASGGMLIRVRRSKGEQTQPAYVAVPWSGHPSTCPVRLVMLQIRQIRTGALFRHVDRHATILNRLQPKAVSEILKHHVRTVLQTNPDVYSSHSLRAGFVTEARARRVPDTLIARHTRHKDLRMLGVYDRPADLFNDPALTGEWW